jgi:predicted MFS family arabinose efflux permease
MRSTFFTRGKHRSLGRPRLRSRVRPELGSTPLLWLLYALFFASGVAQAAIVPLLPRLADAYGLAPSQTALLVALPGLAMLVVSVPAGLAADRLGARRVTLAAGALLCLSCLAQAAPSLPLLLAGRVGFGIAFGVVWTTGMAWLAAIDHGQGVSPMGPSVTISQLGVMTGPAVGGVLAQQAGVGFPFLLIALVAGAVAVPLWVGSREPGRVDGRAIADSGSMPVRALPGVIRRPGVGAAAAALTVAGAVSGVSQLLITLGLHQHGLSTDQIGLAFSAAAVCYALVSAVTVKLGPRARTLRFNALATALLALALVPALDAGYVVALILALILASAPRAAVSTIAFSLASAPAREQGVVFGMLNGAWAAAMVLMPMLAGALDQRAGAQAGYLAVIIPSGAIAVWMMATSRSPEAQHRAVAAGYQVSD